MSGAPVLNGPGRLAFRSFETKKGRPVGRPLLPRSFRKSVAGAATWPLPTALSRTGPSVGAILAAVEPVFAAVEAILDAVAGAKVKARITPIFSAVEPVLTAVEDVFAPVKAQPSIAAPFTYRTEPVSNTGALLVGEVLATGAAEFLPFQQPCALVVGEVCAAGLQETRNAVFARQPVPKGILRQCWCGCEGEK